MVLRTRKSLGRISAFFGNLHGPSIKPEKLSPSHLIWILLASASAGPQYSNLYASSVDRLKKTLATEKGIHSVTQLQNTNPACTLSGPKAVSAKASPASLLVYVDTDEAFQATLQKLRALLEYGEIAKSATGTQILHWSLSTYACIQFHEPKRSRDIAGKCAVVVAIDPATGQDGDVDAWYRKEHLNQLSTSPLFLRCRRYTRIMDPSSIEQDSMDSRVKFLAVHDYTSVQALFDHSVTKGQLVEETEWTRRVMDGAKSVERTIWTLAEAGVNARQ
jgi:hypothetical protein